MLLLGSYTRFSCPLIKWNLQREKNNKSPLHPLYPIFLHPTGWTNRAINELHVSNLFDNNFSLNILYILYAAVLDAMFFSAVFILAALWGVGDAIWQTQINALYGILFPSKEEAAFSNYRLWESIGFIIAFITQV